ncbi:metal ABC transporter solute-binding protein, Zn/Mn family [Castellaniella sp.]|uniref:metal ABC transporter solute-binding protein, Zn/Mn family n=1 Tax=Castellaniella sp. TaxID=1955812 RepID=UPI003C731986
MAGTALALCVAVGIAPSAVQAAGASEDARLPVVASFSILGDIVREVGGDDIRLDVLVGPMRDAHTFEPTPKDARALGRARVLVVNGLGFESWMPRLVEAAGFKGAVIEASRGVQPRRLDDEESAREAHEHGAADHGHAHVDDAGDHDHDHDHAAHDHGGVDPHAWQDLANGVIYARNIARGLAEADPAHAAAYEARAEAYVQALQRADADWRQRLAAVPADRRVLATSHDAFGYFGAAYGIEVLSVVGLSSEAEPSARAMADLVTRIRAHHIRALFLEQGGNARALQQIAAETGVKPGGALYADTLDLPGHEASTYLGMFRWNTQQLLQAFQAP